MSGVVDSGLLERLKSILRRDLKLGPNADVPDDMPLIGGQMDLDSLDILLLVSSVEKQFGIKIPNEAVGRTMFASVSTLAAFIQQSQERMGGELGGGTSATAVPATDWLALLPHGPTFRYVSTVSDVKPGQSARGQWRVDGSEAFFAGHFPSQPIVPGVLLIESLAQLAGIALAAGKGTTRGMLVHADVRFESPVPPPATIDLEVTTGRQMGELHQCDVVASVAGKVVARGLVALRLS
jgi:3-hydroxyacyl-[acyl-carrier-protein] dehydratase